MPKLAFLVSDLQQTGADPKVSDLVRANFVLGEAQKMVRDGICLRFKKWPRSELNKEFWTASVHDASWANLRDFGSQQGQLTGITTEQIKKGPAPIHILDWGSSKVHRKVKSTMASESATASYAYDRGVYCRAIIADLIDGSDRADKWNQRVLRVPQIMATDCRSLVEHINKTGSTCSEKRVALDITDIREGIDTGCVHMDAY